MYRAVLFAPDGDWVTDYPRHTIEEVQEALADQGSRWYFYPFCGVIRDHGLTRGTLRLVDIASPFDGLKGKTISTVSRLIAGCDNEALVAWLS